jgi:iron complex outermembrane receptor protein
MNLIIGWTRGPWNVTGTVKYVSGYDEIPYQGLSTDVNNHDDGGCLGIQYAGTDCTVASFTTLDLAASYKGFKNWEIFGSVINVFNRVAPYAPAAAYGLINYNYTYAYSGATGTQFNAGVRYTFN